MTTTIIQLCALYVVSWIQTSDCHCDPDIPSRPVPYIEDDDNAGSIMCEAGQYLAVETGRCAPCPSGTFMTHAMRNGRSKTCLQCLEAKKSELVVKNCSSTHDTEVHCLTGYFRSKWSATCPCDLGDCAKCNTCGLDVNLYRDHQVLPCTQFQNTKCCEERNSDVDCSPLTTRSVPHATTARRHSTPNNIIPEGGPHRSEQESFRLASSKCSIIVGSACLLMLSTAFNTVVLNILF